LSEKFLSTFTQLFYHSVYLIEQVTSPAVVLQYMRAGLCLA